MEFSDFAKQRPRDFGGSTPPKSPWASQKPPLFAYRKQVYREPAFDCVGAVKRNAPPEKASKQQSEADVTKKIALCGQKKPPLAETRGDNVRSFTLLAEKEGFEPSRRLPDLLP